MSAAENGKVYKIRARTHILQLMGEELIGDDGLAVFELVKNGYDADATEVDVNLNVRSGLSQSIIVLDSGTGMTLEDITGKWLELATDSKRTASCSHKRSSGGACWATQKGDWKNRSIIQTGTGSVSLITPRCRGAGVRGSHRLGRTSRARCIS